MLLLGSLVDDPSRAGVRRQFLLIADAEPGPSANVKLSGSISFFQYSPAACQPWIF